MPTTNTANATTTAAAAPEAATATTTDKAPGEPTVSSPVWEADCLCSRRSLEAADHVAARDIKLRLVIVALLLAFFSRCTSTAEKNHYVLLYIMFLASVWTCILQTVYCIPSLQLCTFRRMFLIYDYDYDVCYVPIWGIGFAAPQLLATPHRHFRKVGHECTKAMSCFTRSHSTY